MRAIDPPVRGACVVLTLALAAGCAPGPAADPAPEADNPFVGAWSLASWESRSADGEVTLPYEGNPAGQIAYTADGRMSAQLMQVGREFPDAAEATGAEMSQAILGGFFSYYGDYSIDMEAGVVTHHVEGALLPSWVGSDRPRSFTFDGPDRLILSTEPDPARGGGAIGTLVWERVAGR
ncbi:lipocalin-like domain-containing protein [Candidatus Palauibacter sp.]|uniref:lipocalin-like domain-containing protein n=1 Tax=Candidatus Palauibacter sp. TaxID=3101350 RepID=UPI003B019178